MQNKTPIAPIIDLINRKPGRKYYFFLIISIGLAFQGIASIIYTITNGLVLWGINNQVAWGITIANFVFWIGIGHAGTLISAILYLFNQEWRSTIHRSAEAMTIIAVICAAIFPVIHTGRPWFALYWLFPYPNQMGMWVNFRSALIWDVFAIGSYFIVSVFFWYLSLIPDFSFLKNKVNSKFLKYWYNVLSLGWNSSSQQWKSYKIVYILIAGLATSLVISVHTIVSFDFATAILPGWHSTIFPPYFVAGAIFSGCAFVILLLIFTRNTFNLKEYITLGQLDNINKIMLSMSLIITFAYLMETFNIYYQNNTFEKSAYLLRISSTNGIMFWLMFLFNICLPQLLWISKLRRNVNVMSTISVFILIGMWLERITIVLPAQEFNYLSNDLNVYFPSIYEISIFAGSFGIFLTLYLLFIRYAPIIPIWELQQSNISKQDHMIKQ